LPLALPTLRGIGRVKSAVIDRSVLEALARLLLDASTPMGKRVTKILMIGSILNKREEFYESATG
jgi:hypothetical protein